MSKNRFVNKCFIALLLAVGAVIITVAYVVGATISHSNAKKSYARTLDYMKKQCISYIEVTSSDEVKSLVRITEQADVIRTDIDRYTGAEGAALLQEYIDSQRLAGAVITDGSLDPVVERHSLGSGYDEWENIIRSTYVSGVMGYPQKIYSERINKSDGCYDIAAVSRTDGDGVVFCYKYQNSAILELTQDPLKNMLAGYETILDGSLFITDGDTILGSNIEEYRGKDVSEFELIEKLDKSSAANRLLRIKSAGRQTYFGGKSSCLGYNIYVFYPHTTVYSTCRSVVIFALGTYMALVLFILILYARTNQAYFREMSSQYETTRTISRIYISSFLIDLKNNRYEYLNLPYLKNRVSREAALSRNLSEMTSLSAVGENYRRGWQEFTDLSTLDSRFEGKEYLEYVYQTNSGAWESALLIEKERGDDGSLNSVILVTRDIDEHKKRELEYSRRLAETAERERLANKAKTDFLRRISHDMRTPINVILGMIEIADHSPEDIGKLAYCRQKSREASEYLLALVNDVLTMNKLDSGKTEIDEKQFSLKSLVNSVFSIASVQAAGRGIYLKLPVFNVTHSDLVGCDLYYRQIVLNILTNAIKYNREGGQVYSEFREIRRDGNSVLVEFVCRDTGIGMSIEFQKKMFEPFEQEQIDNRPEYDGIGLGLPVVKKLVDVMNGTISVSSKKGEGTEFIITIPFKLADSDCAENPEALLSAGTEVRNDDGATTGKTDAKAVTQDEFRVLDNVRVLLVEDNEINMEIAQFILENKGAEVTKAFDGRQALDIFKSSAQGEFNIILMDMMMPVMDGLSATRAIRSLNRPDADTIPIFAMTANLFPEDIQECLNAGMNEHIPKPLKPEYLINKVVEYTVNRREDK